MNDKIFIDSNIFLYTFDNRDEVKQKISKKITLNSDTIISVQVINEVSNTLIKKFKFDNTIIEKFILSCYTRYRVRDLSKKTFLLASSIRDNYNISYYDSLIVASAIVSECTILYSEDMQHKQKIDNLTIINPFKV